MRKIAVLALSVLLFAACQESLEERAAREARQYTEKNCPAPLGEYIVMDSMSFDPSTHTLCYDYRFLGVMDTVAQHPEEMRERLLSALKNATALRLYKEEGYRFRYVYHSQKRPDVVLFEAEFGKDDY